MTNHDANHAGALKAFRLQFSLLAALLFVTVVCLALGYVFRTRYCEATALFQASSQKAALWGNDAGRFDAREFEILQNTQASLIKSYFVMQAAVRDPAIASLSILSREEDPVAWIAEHIEAGFPGNDEILVTRLRGNRVQADELRQIVDAVAKAYEQEVLYAAQQRQLVKRDALARQLDKLNEELASMMKELHEIKAEAEPDAVEVIIQQQEVDNLTDLVREMGRRLELEDLNASAPEQAERIRKIQPATVTFE